MKAAVISLVIIVFVAILAVSVMIKFASNISEEGKRHVHGVDNYRIGQSIFAKIDGTLNKNIANRFPYVSAIFSNSSSSWNVICFGSIILDKWLVTSAHCRRASVEPARHRVLTLYDYVNNSSRMYDVVFWKTHDRYNASNSLYDIAIAMLNIEALLTFKTSNIVEGEATEVDACVWKTLKSMNRRLYLINDAEGYHLTVASPERCSETYNITMNESLICVDLSYYEDCFIYEFGPVYTDGNTLIGVLAVQPLDCEVKFAIFTNVSHYSPWITQAIEVAPF